MTEFKTIEKIQMEMSSRGAVLEYKGFVIVARPKWTGEFTAEIYEFVDTFEIDGINTIECRLSEIEKSEITFKDGGSAIEWCIKKLI